MDSILKDRKTILVPPKMLLEIQEIQDIRGTNFSNTTIDLIAYAIESIKESGVKYMDHYIERDGDHFKFDPREFETRR